MGLFDRITYLFQGFNWLIIPAALFAIVIHEISHGYAAYMMGDRTAKDGLRLSLNPVEHISFLGLLCMVLFGFGWAKPVPINPRNFKHRKLGMVLVSIAGPLSNLVMATISLFLMMLLAPLKIQNAVLLFILQLLYEFFLLSAILNVGLAVFNLLPIPPLDGSKILFELLPRRAYNFVLEYEPVGVLILLVLINIPFFSDFLLTVREFIFNGMVDALSPIFF